MLSNAYVTYVIVGLAFLALGGFLYAYYVETKKFYDDKDGDEPKLKK